MSGTAAAQPVPAHPPGVGPRGIGKFRSPDGLYFVRLFVGEAGTTDFQAYRGNARLHSYKGRSRGLLTELVHDSNGWLWLPGRGHTLVFAVSGLYGKAALAMWSGDRLIPLLRAQHPTEESFTLYGTSRSGKVVYYGHGGAEQFYDQLKRGKLTLSSRVRGGRPRSQ
jgi:hypothetical protein